MEYKGFTEYDARDFDALDLHLRGIGMKPVKLHTLDVHGASWDDLHKAGQTIMRSAQAVLKALGDDAGEAECRKGEGVHNVLLAAHDFIDGEMDRRKSFGQRTPLTAEQRGIPNGADGSVVHNDDGSSEFIPEGRARGSRVEWRDRKGNAVRVYAPDESVAERRSGRSSVGEIAKAMIFGAKRADLTDAERRALAEGTDSAGGYTVPTVLASEFIDKLRAATVVFQAGARTVPMTSDNLAIARITGDPTVAWTAENAEITASDPTFDAVTLAPKKLTCIVKVSRELLEDSVNISAALEAAIVGSMSVELDHACLFGTGSAMPLGLSGISGINSSSMGTNGATPTSYDELIDAIYQVQLDNGADPKVFVMHPRTNKTYATLKDANSNPLTEPRMTADLRRLLTTAVPINEDQGTATGVCSTVLTGDFSKMLVGMRVGLELRLLNERYAEFDQVGFIARLRADVAVENPVHFCKLIGIKP